MAFGSLIPLLSNRASICSARDEQHVRPTAAAAAAAGHRRAEDARNIEPVRAATEANISISTGQTGCRIPTLPPLLARFSLLCYFTTRKLAPPNTGRSNTMQLRLLAQRYTNFWYTSLYRLPADSTAHPYPFLAAKPPSNC